MRSQGVHRATGPLEGLWGDPPDHLWLLLVAGSDGSLTRLLPPSLRVYVQIASYSELLCGLGPTLICCCVTSS